MRTAGIPNEPSPILRHHMLPRAVTRCHLALPTSSDWFRCLQFDNSRHFLSHPLDNLCLVGIIRMVNSSRYRIQRPESATLGQA
jgi:hypothetical protein